MKKKINIIPPKMPNFVRFEKPSNLKQEGFKVDEGFDIANFTEKEALEFAKLMKRTFLEHYQSRKARKQLFFILLVVKS